LWAGHARINRAVGIIQFTFGALLLALMNAVASGETPKAPGVAALVPLLALEPGDKACYIRNYDAAHLRLDKAANDACKALEDKQ
jgi:hypothetical protein